MLACNFRYLNEGYQRSFLALRSRAPMGAVYLGLNLQKPFPLCCYLFLVQGKCKMPLDQKKKLFSPKWMGVIGSYLLCLLSNHEQKITKILAIKFFNTVIRLAFTTGFDVAESEADCNTLKHSAMDIGHQSLLSKGLLLNKKQGTRNMMLK